MMLSDPDLVSDSGGAVETEEPKEPPLPYSGVKAGLWDMMQVLHGEAELIETAERNWMRLGNRPDGPLPERLRQVEILRAAFRLIDRVRDHRDQVFAIIAPPPKKRRKP